jgi:hypothetical protein
MVDKEATEGRLFVGVIPEAEGEPESINIKLDPEFPLRSHLSIGKAQLFLRQF